MPYEPPPPESTDRLRDAAKARGRAIRRRRRQWLLAAGAAVAMIGLGGGLAAAQPFSHPATRVHISGQPPPPSDSTSSTSTGGPGDTAPNTTTSTTTAPGMPPDKTGPATSFAPATTATVPPQVCTPGQVSLSAHADKSSYAWGDPISLTITLSLVGTTPCLVNRSGGAGFHGDGCMPQFYMQDTQPTPTEGLVGPWAQSCTNAVMGPFLLTAQTPDVVDMGGAVNCDADPDQACGTPTPGTRSWQVMVQWSWSTSSGSIQTAGSAQFDFNVAVTGPNQTATTATTAAPTTTTAPAPTTTIPATTTTVTAAP